MSFAVWDRRRPRPFEAKVKTLEDELTSNRPHVQALLESLRTLGQRVPELVAVLKTFNF